ncbi:BC1881 family protein [Drancourtella massiliensis]|uniref:BC1881 family protein n=1 Tax=Drancourtella massiliensis TaxID=1632013 RepID=A0ABS2EJY3_9FIRM|nr:BC1881 family protein [Drancourtella massiliensis]MBM6745249.1 BC1881 family protein [Drancourtella massiliensis]
MPSLKEYSTHDLVNELEGREGVSTEYAEPHQDKKLSVNGPAKILVIID